VLNQLQSQRPLQLLLGLAWCLEVGMVLAMVLVGQGKVPAVLWSWKGQVSES
jgi:hypothetical protein